MLNQRICHVNLSAGYRGGERQTEILLEQNIANSFVKPVLVVLDLGELHLRWKNRADVICIAVKGRLAGHYSKALKNISLYHAHESKAAHWVLIQTSFHKAPYVITRRVEHPLKNNWFTRKVHSKASVVIGISNAIIKYLREYGLARLELIPDATDLPLLSPSVGALEVSLVNSRPLKILQAGALIDSNKGQSIAIKAMRLVKKKCTLDIFGDGPDGDELNSLIEKLSLEEVVKLHPWPGSLVNFIREYDIFIMPSLHEGLGSILIDVMRMRLPIVASKVGGIPDLIEDEVNGILFESGSPEDLAKAIDSLTPEKRERFVKEAAKISDRFTAKTIFDQHVKIYKLAIR